MGGKRLPGLGVGSMLRVLGNLQNSFGAGHMMGGMVGDQLRNALADIPVFEVGVHNPISRRPKP